MSADLEHEPQDMTFWKAGGKLSIRSHPAVCQGLCPNFQREYSINEYFSTPHGAPNTAIDIKDTQVERQTRMTRRFTSSPSGSLSGKAKSWYETKTSSHRSLDALSSWEASILHSCSCLLHKHANYNSPRCLLFSRAHFLVISTQVLFFIGY